MIPFPVEGAPADGVAFDADLLNRLPPPIAGAARASMWAQLDAPWTSGRGIDGRRVIVVDDDPTGTQTVRGASLITSWEDADLQWLLARPERIGFVLTNSRAGTERAAIEANLSLAARLRVVGERRGLELDVVSRSDSTLRGHFPAELDALAAGLGRDGDSTLIVPFFAEGGRITINGAHYVRQDQHYLPARETPFARDATFGYSRSYLPAWIEEKTAGRVAAASVTVLDIATIRVGGFDAVVRALLNTEPGAYVTVDAVNPTDLEIVVAAVRRTEVAGRRWRYRSAAGLIPPLAGLRSAPPIDPPAPTGGRGGLVVVGSHVPLSSSQLEALLDRRGVDPIEADVAALADEATAPAEVARLEAMTRVVLDEGRIAAVHTSRTVLTGDDGDASLAISRRVAAGLCRLVAGLPRPGYLVAKGGITAHTLAVDGLSARRARVLGPIIPGVPMLAMDEGTRFPGLPYVVFPGNVGEPDSLVQVIDRLEAARP